MMQATKELTIFKDKKLRIEMINGEPYFCLLDILSAIGVIDTGSVLQKLRASEVYKVHPGIIAMIDTETETGRRSMAYVSEAGMYEVVIGSRKSKAKEFHRQIIVALPALRQNNQNAELIAQLQARIEKLERGGDHLLTTIPEISMRSQLNMIVRKFVARQVSGYSYEDAWNELYYQFKYRYHRDLKAGARNKKCDVLDYAEKEGLLPDVLNLTLHIFRAIEA